MTFMSKGFNHFNIETRFKIFHNKCVNLISGVVDESTSYYQKAYYFPRYLKATWIEAKTICKAYDLELASFKTFEEANAVMDMIRNNAQLGSIDSHLWVFIDGIALTPRSTTDWYWTGTGEKTDFAMSWLPGQPDTAGNAEYYLSIGRFKKDGTLGFNDIPGRDHLNKFLCQKHL